MPATQEKELRYFRKVIRIRAEDSPNVRRALYQRDVLGIEPTGEIVIPGVLPWDDYCQRRKMWDAIRQCIGLDADFYEGAEILLFPPEWLNRAETIATSLAHRIRRATAIGIDPAEGGDKTTMCAVDNLGIIEMVSKKTPQTEMIINEAMAFIRKHQVREERVLMDQGGGGTQHAGELRRRGIHVRTVPFGQGVTPALKRNRRRQTFWEQTEQKEVKYAYFNKRAELYGTLRNLLDPSLNPQGFGIPASLTTLRQELSPIPLLYDQEGRLWLLPKRKPKHNREDDTKSDTLVGLIGHSPDQADALALAVYAMLKEVNRPRAGML